MNLQLKAIETTNIEQRLTKLEKRLAEADGELDDKTQVRCSSDATEASTKFLRIQWARGTID
jgi:hypothetical protein